MYSCIVAESSVPLVAAAVARADEECRRHREAHRQAFFAYFLELEIHLMNMDFAHKKIVNHFLKDGVIDSLDTFTGVQIEEKNVWAALRQVGPIPSVSHANTDCSNAGLPFKALIWPYQGSKIWDWMKGARPEDVIPKLKKTLPTKPSPEVKPLPVNKPLPTSSSVPSSEVSTPRSSSPIESSSSTASSDSEDNSAPSSSSFDSGYGSEKSGSSTKKLKKYKVLTAEEIERRDKIVDDWQKKIRASLLT